MSGIRSDSDGSPPVRMMPKYPRRTKSSISRLAASRSSIHPVAGFEQNRQYWLQCLTTCMYPMFAMSFLGEQIGEDLAQRPAGAAGGRGGPLRACRLRLPQHGQPPRPGGGGRLDGGDLAHADEQARERRFGRGDGRIARRELVAVPAREVSRIDA